MHFDAKTKRFYGEIEEITPEKIAYLDEQVRKGNMICISHPSQEEIDAAERRRDGRPINEGIEEFLKEKGYWP